MVASAADRTPLRNSLDDLRQRDGGVDLAVLLARDCDSDAIGPLAVSASRS
jgi:hypothetical protein